MLEGSVSAEQEVMHLCATGNMQKAQTTCVQHV